MIRLFELSSARQSAGEDHREGVLVFFFFVFVLMFDYFVFFVFLDLCMEVFISYTYT